MIEDGSRHGNESSSGDENEDEYRNGDGNDNTIREGGGKAKKHIQTRKSCRRDQALSFRARHHLCRQGVVLAGTQQPRSQNLVTVNAHRTELTGSGAETRTRTSMGMRTKQEEGRGLT